LLAVNLIVVVVVAQSPDAAPCEPGLCGGASMLTAFRQAVRSVLGNDTQVQASDVASELSNEEVASKAEQVDGVVEVSFASQGQQARLHCYLSREKRWVDREIAFGESRGSLRSEIGERGRLLGFAVGTMLAPDSPETARPAEPIGVANEAPQPTPPAPDTVVQPRRSEAEPGRAVRRLAEFGAVMSSGLSGTAAGVGASAAARVGLSGPVWARGFIAGRTGNIPEAQASTLTALAGAGLALALLPESSRFELGARVDAFASYFEASHLSEDDVEPDRRSRWLPGGDLMAEGGWRATHSAGVFAGVGVEGMFGETAIYTHHRRAAVVPPFRVVAELGFRIRF
jgi:hypothetical protein